MLLALLALAAPLPAFAISDQAFEPVTASPGPAAISVSTSLDSCGVLEDGVVCKIDVSFNSVPNADSYSATVTRADGSVIDYGGVGAGGTSLWVPYVGSGNYSVRITAYGEPESPEDPDGRGDVIATGYSRSGDKDKPDKDPETTRDHATETATEITGRDPGTAPENAAADGAATSEVGASAAADVDLRPGRAASAATDAADRAARGPRPGEPRRGRRRDPRRAGADHLRAADGRVPGRARRADTRTRPDLLSDPAARG